MANQSITQSQGNRSLPKGGQGEGLQVCFDEVLENTVLATLMLSPLMPMVEHILTPECFYLKKNQCIYEAIHKCYLDGRDYDMINVRLELDATPGNQVTAYDLCANLDQTSSGEVVHHAMILRDLKKRRKLWEILQGAMPYTTSIQAPINDALVKLNDDIIALLSDGPDEEFITLRQSIVALKQVMRQNQQDPHANEGLMTGFPLIDNYGGLSRGSLTVLAARPGHGKSAMALQWAAYATQAQGKRVAYFSFEMAHDELTSRLLSSHTRIAPHVLLHKPVTEHQYEAVEYAERHLGENGTSDRLLFEYKTHVRFDEVRAQIMRLCNNGGLDGVVIDYLQLFSKATKQRDDTDNTFYGNITRELKNMAMMLRIPFVVLSQLNRGAADGNARNSNLRGSGEIEEASDNVVILDQPGIDHRQYSGALAGQETQGTASLSITKSRSFRVGGVALLDFRGEEMRFSERRIEEGRALGSEERYGGIFGE